MASNTQSRTIAACMIGGLGCFIASVFVGLLSRLPFENYDLAFSYQLPLTVSGDAGCLIGLLFIALLSRMNIGSPSLAGYSVAFISTGLAIASLLKAGFIVPTTPGSLLMGDFLVALFAIMYMYCWWMVYAALGEKVAVRRLALALMVGIVVFFLVNAVPTAWGRMATALVLPLVSCLSFLPLLVEWQGGVQVFVPGQRGHACGESVSSAVFPRVVLVTIALSFFVVDLELDLFPLSLYFEDIVFETLPVPAIACLVMLLVFAVVLYFLVGRGPIPLPVLYTTGFILAALGYLVTPYRIQGGFPLAASEAGRVIIALFAIVLVLRFLDRRGGEGNAGRLFLDVASTAFIAMLVADVIVVVMQLQEGFNYGDFVFRTVFSGCCTAALVVLLLGPLPRAAHAFEPEPEQTPKMPAPLKYVCERFAQRYDLSVRETEVLTLIACGRDVPYIENELVLAKSTVKTHIKHIYEKCGVSSRQKLLDLIEDFES